jgi:protein O-GlcNAc transferase
VDPSVGPSVSRELLDKLGALGYVGSGSPIETSTPGADPKDKIEEFRRASSLIREAVELFHEGDYEESVARYRALLDIPIESFELHLNLGRGLVALERYEEAEPHFEEAVRRLETDPDALEGLSRCRSARGDLAGALEALKEAQKARPDDADFRQREGALLIRMGRPVEARTAYEAAVERAPKDPLLRARFGELLRSQGENEGSIRELREAVALAPDDATYVNSLGMTLGGNGRLPEAEEAFRRALDLDPKNARYAFNVALILMRQSRPDDARPFFERALVLEPRFDEARRYLAEIDGK